MGRPEGHRSRLPKASGFHEIPLVFFSAFAIAGSGVAVAHLGLSILTWVPLVPTRDVMALVGGLLAFGLLFSVAHLGKPLRGPLALYRVGKSPLSNEVLVVGLATTASLLFVVLPTDHALAAPSALAALVGCLLTLLALSLVYRLGGQLTWTGLTLIHPLVFGIAFGLTVLLGSLPAGTQARGELLVLAILLTDGLLVWARAGRLGVALPKGVPAHPRLMAQRGAASILRILLGVLLPAVALLNGLRELALIGLFSSMFLDRILFYGLAVRVTTEGEIQGVEAVLRAKSGTIVENRQPAPLPIHTDEG